MQQLYMRACSSTTAAAFCMLHQSTGAQGKHPSRPTHIVDFGLTPASSPTPLFPPLLNLRTIRSWKDGKAHPFLLDNVWELLQLLDYFETRPREIDMRRVAMTGVSLGGMHTWLTSVLDERVAVVAPMIGIQVSPPGGASLFLPHLELLVRHGWCLVGFCKVWIATLCICRAGV